MALQDLEWRNIHLSNLLVKNKHCSINHKNVRMEIFKQVKLLIAR